MMRFLINPVRDAWRGLLTLIKRHPLPLLVIVLLNLFYIIFLFWIYNRHPNGASDFNVYFRGATRVVEGTPLYTNLKSNDYVGPSLIVQLLAPLVSLTDYTITKNIWLALSLLAHIAATGMIAGVLSTWRGRTGLWVVSILLLPTFLALWIGQFSVILFFLLIWAW